MARKSGLGKGLEALFEDNSSSVSENGQEMIKISEISPNKDQPRKEFDLAALEQLADSIREHGGDTAADSSSADLRRLSDRGGRTAVSGQQNGWTD